MSEIKKLKINGVTYDLGGGGSDFDIHSLTEENAIGDTDEMPFYDASASASRKTAWSNIKAKLKAYFDTLYNKVTKTSELENDSGFLTEHQSLAAYRTASAQDIIDNGKASAASVTAIEAKIPSAATGTNQLADKAFVNSTVGTNTAIFRGTYNSVAELEAYSGEKTNNDYAFVITTDSVGNTVYNRYKYNGTAWVFEYALNNSSFTAVQWAAIQSGITAEDVALIGTAVQPSELGDYALKTDLKQIGRACYNLFAKAAFTEDVTSLMSALWLLVGNTLTSISAVFTQGSTIIYPSTSLDSLKSMLVVTATYDDSTTAVVNDYTLSGTLAEGTSIITATYNGKTAIFNVTVTAEPTILTGYTSIGNPNIVDNILTPSANNFIKTPEVFSPNGQSWELRTKVYFNSPYVDFQDVWGSVDNNNTSARVVLSETYNNGQKIPIVASVNGTAWDLLFNDVPQNGTYTDFSLDAWSWFKFGWDGEKYYVSISTDGINYTTNEQAKTTAIMDGYAIGFGLKRNAVLSGKIDLNETEISINNHLWWKAVSA